MELNMDASWKRALKSEFEKPYFSVVSEAVDEAYASDECYPPAPLIFRAMKECTFDEVKVVIIGQDPYINPNQANGLAFSVNPGVPFPPSLRNIHKELVESGALKGGFDGDLSSWAKQGVLLLNATLTVKAGESNSHEHLGWSVFTDAIIEALAKHKSQVVYLLWGGFAQKKAKVVDSKNNLILKAPHPSPLSAYRGFFGCGHFHHCNEYLVQQNKVPIQW